jgi:hypothetical protein
VTTGRLLQLAVGSVFLCLGTFLLVGGLWFDRMGNERLSRSHWLAIVVVRGPFIPLWVALIVIGAVGRPGLIALWVALGVFVVSLPLRRWVGRRLTTGR